MIIKITPPVTGGFGGLTGPSFLLADDTQSSSTFSSSTYPNGIGGMVVKDNGFVPKMTLVTQSEELINSTWKEELPRGNQQMTYTFIVFRDFNTLDNALAFLADHPVLVPTFGTLSVTIGATTRYLKNATLVDYGTVEQAGTATQVSYSYRGSYAPPVAGAAGTGTGGPFTTS